MKRNAGTMRGGLSLSKLAKQKVGGGLHQAKLRDLEGVVVLKKSKFGHDLSDLLEYKSLLSAGSSIPDTIACLRQLQCIHAGREVISEAGIEGTIIDLLFHENRDVSKAASDLLQQWQKQLKESPSLDWSPREIGDQDKLFNDKGGR